MDEKDTGLTALLRDMLGIFFYFYFFFNIFGKTQPRGRMPDQEYVLTPKQKQGQSNIFESGPEDDGRNETYRNRLETQALRPKEGVGPAEIPRILFELPFSDSGGAVNKASGRFDIGMDFMSRSCVNTNDIELLGTTDETLSTRTTTMLKKSNLAPHRLPLGQGRLLDVQIDIFGLTKSSRPQEMGPEVVLSPVCIECDILL